jgi:arylsulfatase A-like enzyme
VGKQKSILLVTVDCLRADRVGFMGYRRPTTPFLDALAKNDDAFVIPTAIVAGAPTYYSLPAVLASRFPLALGRDVLGLGPTEPTLASVLKQAGYATAAFAAGNPYISSRFGYRDGFDTFQDFVESEGAPLGENAPEGAIQGWAGLLNRQLQQHRAAMGPLKVLYDELYFRYCQRKTPAPDSLDALRRFPSADVIVDRACEWLSSLGDTPFFLWLHLMDPHSPYYPKPEALALMNQPPVTPYRARYLNSYWNRSDLGPSRFERHRDDVVALYDAGIRWADQQMARFNEFLHRSNRWDDCIFTLTADHGEEFLDHGGRYHPPDDLKEELIHVPLLMRVPGSKKREAAKSPFSLMHLAPTLLDAADLPVPQEFQGRSQWTRLQAGEGFDEAAISECVAGCTNPFRRENRMGPRVLSIRESRHKLVLHFDPANQELSREAPGREDLYDLEADPGEQSPLASSSQKPVRRRLLEIAREHLRRSSVQRDGPARVRARLRELQIQLQKPAGKASSLPS